MNESLYIRLAAPLQSWAGPAVTGNIVRTERFPTRSGLIGLLAAALGAKRGEFPNWLDDVEFVVREDRAPYFTDDFHTINYRPEADEFRRRLLIAERGKARGKKALVFTPDAQGGTSVVNRTYLADGEFIVRITCEEHADELEDALGSPGFTTYLGRKAFAPEFPFYLGCGAADMIRQIPTLSAPGKDLQRTLSTRRPVVQRVYGPYHPREGGAFKNLFQ
ncbi:type I-E CRISPR-associated protein Cas5/CasD [Arcanobacterium hippocoleae]|uniref:type I-E CRISPR-associated protein Cas5/CasD n=1 Tax=Arcanobacterium hippocoleae TaxID=149017 RepID=UPI0033408F20